MATDLPESSNLRAAYVNARIDRLPRLGIPGSAFFPVFAVFWIFSLWDVTIIGAGLPYIAKDFDLSGSALALPVTFNLVGYIVGAYVFGTISDYIGRRKTMQIIVVVLTVGALASALSWDLTSLTVFRAVTGLGTGAQITLASTYSSEMSPARKRGKYSVMNALWGGVGQGIAPLVALSFIAIPGVGWRIALGIGALSIVTLLFIRKLPESPRWLAVHGRLDEAENLVGRMETYVSERHGAELPALGEIAVEQRQRGFPTFALFRRPFIGRIAAMIAFWFAFDLVAYTVLGYEPELLSKMGYSTFNSVAMLAAGDLAFPIGAIFALLMVERVQRKWLVSGTVLLSAVFLAIFALSTSTVMVVASSVLFVFFLYAGSASGLVYNAEIFPTRARASAVSVSDGIGHAGGALGPIIGLAALTAWGPRPTWWLLAGIMLVGAAVIGISGIRSTGRGLAELSGDGIKADASRIEVSTSSGEA